MSKNRQSLEQPMEELRFRLLMDRHAEEDGREILDEFARAQADGTAPPMPEELSQKCRAAIEKRQARNRRQKTAKHAKRILGRVAVIVLVLFGVSAVAISSIEALRVPVLNFLLEQHEEYTVVRAEESDGAKNIADPEDVATDECPLAELIPELIPEEYSLLSYYRSEEIPAISASYVTDAGASIRYLVSPADSAMRVNTENAQVRETTLLTFDALFVEKDGYAIVWINPLNQMKYYLYASDLDYDTFWQLAETLASDRS